MQGRWRPLDNVVKQLIAEIQQKAEEINKLDFGDIVFRIQNKTLITWDVKKTFKPERPARKTGGLSPKA